MPFAMFTETVDIDASPKNSGAVSGIGNPGFGWICSKGLGLAIEVGVLFRCKWSTDASGKVHDGLERYLSTAIPINVFSRRRRSGREKQPSARTVRTVDYCEARSSS